MCLAPQRRIYCSYDSDKGNIQLTQGSTLPRIFRRVYFLKDCPNYSRLWAVQLRRLYGLYGKWWGRNRSCFVTPSSKMVKDVEVNQDNEGRLVLQWRWAWTWEILWVRNQPVKNQRIHGCQRIKQSHGGTSLVVQWLRLCAPNAGGIGSISCQGARSCMPQLRSKIQCAEIKTWHSQ